MLAVEARQFDVAKYLLSIGASKPPPKVYGQYYRILFLPPFCA